MTTTRRKSLVAKPSFQIKLTIIFMLMVTIVANLVGGLCFFLERAELLFPKIFVAQCVSLIIVFMLCIWVTHTIAGPLYRMERVAGEIGDGDLSMFTRLRPKDELKELADAFNYMSRALARKIYAIKDATAIIEKTGTAKDGVDALKAVIDRFKLPTRDVLWQPVSPDESDEPVEAADQGKAGADPTAPPVSSTDDPAGSGAPAAADARPANVSADPEEEADEEAAGPEGASSPKAEHPQGKKKRKKQ
ncbi:MAG: HAMP domain-containing protein [Candidatus Riflebacteria bacterium]|nr:HAMP domain-containing protein [Candidatus Riflebacteria bacterium]